MHNSGKIQAIANPVAKIIGTATVLGLLYLGRDVLIPITLAITLSILITPFIRLLRRVGCGHSTSVGISVLILTLALTAMSAILGAQIIRFGSSLPQYEETIRSKLDALDKLTLGKLSAITSQADRVIGQLSGSGKSGHTGNTLLPGNASADSTSPISVELHEPPPKPIQLLSRIIASVSGPVEMAGVVFVVLVFVLLEHEALRDRFIRLVGSNNLRATTIAVNDAGERLSRFFVSQSAVNIVVGILVWAGLTLIGLPQALLWGSLAAVLRIVPYIGVWIAALMATLLAAAISPGWSLAIMTLLLFFGIEMIISQWVEPKLYGHATGLSPLSVVIAAIFWSWIWGPVGLVLSTPLTLCLVVAGRYMDGLHFLEILLGDIPALTMPENFYQRALAGDAQELIAGAEQFLKRKSLGAYCDSVLVPALHLARTDLALHAISKAEQLRVGSSVAAVLIALEGKQKWWKPNMRVSVLEDVTIARQLRARREHLTGKWQGPLDAPTGTVVLAIGTGSQEDELATEILVRVLRAQNIDSRHLALDDLDGPPPSDAAHELVSVVCLVSVSPDTEQDQFFVMSEQMRKRCPRAVTLALCLTNPFEKTVSGHSPIACTDQTTYSYEGATQYCLEILQHPLSPRLKNNP